VKRLKDILYKVALREVAGSTDRLVSSVCIDSREVRSGDLFMALPGTTMDGHRFIDKAVALGAVAVVCEKLPVILDGSVTYLKVDDSRLAAGIIAANFYDNPSTRLQLVGVTGTNGKTTVTTLLYEVFTSLGYKTGLLSTIRNIIAGKVIPATHTTPDPVTINSLLAKMVEEGCTYAFMEVSSHACDQQRIAGLSFAGAVFTNISHDHLDYHKTLQEYIFAKKKLFDQLPAGAFALVNIDDKRGLVMLQNTRAKKQSYSLTNVADFRLKIIEHHFGGMVFEIDGHEVFVQIIGRFNAYNLLAVYATSTLLGIPAQEALRAISLLHGAEGRFDHIRTEKDHIVGIVDYAHTPDALKNVLQTIQEIRTGNERVLTVVGCGGNRDAAKRPKMAMIAAELSDMVILTSDNPRNEDPADILREMKAGVPAHRTGKVLVVEDRREAIKVACTMAQPEDIILLAGKGHEKYQEIKGEKFPFDDKEILTETLQQLGR
jgi:UDP-N-acetylmuramoyl-L-alanyl-D-glutamate--2,6-diaminopimelate ligase